MNAERLLELYDRIAVAPDAIVRLRRFVLDAAITGSFIGDYENWIKVPIEKCLEPLEDGKFIHQGWSPRCETFPASTLEKWGVLKTTAIQDGFFLEDENKELPSHLSPKEKLEISAGDILLTCAGPRARCGIACTVPSIRPRLLMSGKMYRFRADRSQILTEYLGLFLRTSMSWAAIDAMKTGSSESGLNLTKDRFRNFEVQFGSLDEQRKILAKVNELMALLDRLEAARMAREATRDRLTAASLARLGAPDPDPATFQDHAAFALDNLAPLTTRPDQIKPLRQTILNLAVRGKLVEQDPADEPASELLKRIEAEDVDQDELPKQWYRATVGNVLDFKYGKGLKASERLEEGPIPVFGSNGIVGYTDEPITDQPSIIVGRKGSAGALNLCSGPSWTTDVAYFVEPPSFFDLRYLFLTLASLDLDTLGKGVKPGLSRADAYPLELSIPPLAEQHRIVAKVDELMSLCDQLEARLVTADTTRQRLLEALLHED